MLSISFIGAPGHPLQKSHRITVAVSSFTYNPSLLLLLMYSLTFAHFYETLLPMRFTSFIVLFPWGFFLLQNFILDFISMYISVSSNGFVLVAF